MRYVRILVRTLAATMMAGMALAQEAEPPRRFAPPAAGEVLRIDRRDAPAPLQAALRRDCWQEPDPGIDPRIQIFVPAPYARPMAIVHCGWIVAYSRAFVFERSVSGEPTLMRFPVMARPQGVTTSEHVGLMNWDPETRTITAVHRSDLCDDPAARHTWRHQGGGALNGFALVRVEHGKRAACADYADWTVLWEAAPWALPK